MGKLVRVPTGSASGRGKAVPRLRSLVPVREVSKRRPHTLVELAIEESRYAYRDACSWRCRDDVFVRDASSGVEVMLSRRSLADGQPFTTVSFCGTERWVDWACNMTLFLANVVDGAQGRAHAGFLSRWRSVRKKLLAALPRVCARDAGLVVTGHSLGGALAALAAPDIALHMPKTNVSLVTFGAPMFADARYNGRSPPENLRTSIRCVHVEDVVQHLPPLPFYTHSRFGATLVVGERESAKASSSSPSKPATLRHRDGGGPIGALTKRFARCMHGRSVSVRSHEILCYWRAIVENDVRYTNADQT